MNVIRSLWSNRRFHLAIIVSLIFLSYLKSLRNGFVWDDYPIIVENPLLHGWINLPRLFFAEDTMSGIATGYYRPVTYLSFFVDRAIWGLNPFGFHLTNLLLHLSVCIVFYLLIARITKNDLLAFISALLFALHPINSEAVNFVSARNALLSALFALLSFIYYTRDRRKLSIIFFGFSLFSKEFGLFLPLLLFAYDWVIAAEKKPLRRFLPYVAVIALYLAMRSMVVGGNAIDLGVERLASRVMLMPELFLRYIKILLIPWPLAAYYPIRLPLTFDSKVFAYMAGFIAVIGLFFPFRKNRIVLFAALWFVIFLIPVLNILPITLISMAERYAYFSAMGFSLLCAYLTCKINRRFLALPIITLCTLYGIIIVNRNPIWKDEQIFFRKNISDYPNLSFGYNNLGVSYYYQGETEKARQYLEKAAGLYPQMPESFSLLGSIYLEMGDNRKAIHFLEKAASLEPQNFTAYLLLNRIYEESGNPETAEAYLKKARAVLPSLNKDSLRGMALQFCIEGETLLKEDRLEEAEIKFRRSLLYDPRLARTILGLGNVVGEKGNIDAAIGYFRKAAEYEPLNPVPHYNLSQAYKAKGMHEDSEHEMSIYIRLGGNVTPR